MAEIDDACLPGALGSDPKLRQLRPHFRHKIGHVLAELEAEGYQPRISNAYRSAEAQQRKYDAGLSKTSRPGHHHWGLAADIIDRRWGWVYTESCAQFFLALRAACDRHDVANGGWWKRSNGWKMWGLGWDPAHCFDHLAGSEARVKYGPDEWG